MKNYKILLGCLFWLTMTSSAWAFVTVGTDIACSYNNLQDAYEDDDPYVKVTSQITFNENFVISKPKWFTDGYANCDSIYNGNPPLENTKTTWSDLGNQPTVHINAAPGTQSSVGQLVVNLMIICLKNEIIYP